MPDSVLTAVSASAPGVLDRLRDRSDIGDVRRQLHEQRQRRGPADGGRHLARGRRVDRELEAALADVGTGDVELDAGNPGHAVESSRDLDVVRDRLAGHVHDDRHLPRVPGVGVLLDHGVDARVLEPDRVQHSTRRFGHAGRRIADARLQRRALAADRPEALDVDDVAVLDAVPEGARGDKHRIGKHESPIRHERHGQVDLARPRRERRPPHRAGPTRDPPARPGRRSAAAPGRHGRARAS